MNVQPENIPTELKALPQWVVWRYDTRPGESEPTKVLYNPKTGGRAMSNNADTWSTFDAAFTTYQNSERWDGIGFVLTAADPYAVIDLDKCILSDGYLSDSAADIVRDFASYTETTPSGTGVRVIFRGKLPEDKGRQTNLVAGCKKIELYNHVRFVTVTGNYWQGSPVIVESRQEALDLLYARLFPPKPIIVPTKRNANLAALPDDDTELMAQMLQGKNGQEIAALFSGNIRHVGGDGLPDDSAADMALCNYLAIYTRQDAIRMDRLFRTSALYRDKWDSPRPGGTYGSNTIAKAIRECLIPDWSPAGVEVKLRGESQGESADSPQDALDSPETAPETLGDTDKPSRMEQRAHEKEAKKKERNKRSVDVVFEDGLPSVETNHKHLRNVSTAALEALQSRNDPPHTFVRGGQLVRVFLDTDKPAAIQAHTPASFRGVLARCANFVSTSFDRGTVPVSPPAVVVEDILALPSWSGVPFLSGVVTAPVVSANGDLETTPGYLPLAQLYYHDSDRQPLPNTEPTPENIAAAKLLLIDTLMADFPFVDEAGKAHALAMLLLPFVRPCIAGATPMHLVDAPVPGSGKSLLVEVLTGIFVPGSATLTPGDVKDDDEWRKRITTGLLSGTSHIWFDNINRKVDSGSLAAALTAREWKDRLLGGNTEASMPVRCTWIATGNNTQLSDEITRRTIYIRLDPQMERPWDREGFKISDIRGYVTENRGALLGAALTLVRAWLAAGRPSYSGKLLGSYEAWSRVMGGLLETVGVPGFLANRAELFEKADPEREAWMQFLAAWWEKFKDAKCGMNDLFPIAIETAMVDGHEGKERAEKNTFGRALRAKADRFFGEYRFKFVGTHNRGAQYQCECNESNESTESKTTPIHNVLKLTPPADFNTLTRTVENDSVDSFDSFSTIKPGEVGGIL